MERARGWLVVAALATLLTACTGDAPPPPSPDGSPGQTGAAQPEPESGGQEPSDRAVRPRTAGQALRLLTWAEDVIGDAGAAEPELRRAARQQQLAYRELGEHRSWDATVLAGLSPPLRSVVRDNVASRREFRAMHSVLSDELPAWRIVEPSPAEQLLRLYQRAERASGVGWEYLAAINLVETGMGRIRGTSVAGAQGPMQFLPTTWARWGRGDIEDPGDSILAAARYLAHDGGARPGRIGAALFRYNNSTRYVRGVTLLARVMERRPRAYYGYYHWDVYYLTARGDVRLPVGYDQDRPVPVERWLASHPQG
jgi:membrane-bound lytic murein transglycosylase B